LAISAPVSERFSGWFRAAPARATPHYRAIAIGVSNNY